MTDDPYTELRARFADVAEVEVSAGRGAQGLKLGGKMFAMFYKGQLLVKLDPERVRAVIASGDGLPHDPGTGSPMRDRLLVPTSHRHLWVGYAEESWRYEASLRRR